MYKRCTEFKANETPFALVECGMKEALAFCLNFEGCVLTPATGRSLKFVLKSKVGSRISFEALGTMLYDWLNAN